MNKRLGVAKSISVEALCIGASLYSGFSTAAVMTDTMQVTSVPASELRDTSYLGGILLPAAAASPTLFETLKLSEVAAYAHLVVTDDPKDAGEEVDLIESGSIVVGVFHSVAIPIRGFPVSARWDPIMRGVRECAAHDSCSRHELLDRIAIKTEGKSLAEKVRIVNSAVNSTISYRADRSLYGELDHWATPSEILSRGSGDCEDFAILKMTALMRAGIPAKSLSLVVLRENNRGVFHAVLAVATSSGSFILDNTRPKVLKDADLPDYQPLYSLSDDRAWIHGNKVSEQPAALADIVNFPTTAVTKGYAAPGSDSHDPRNRPIPLRSRRFAFN
jgi:predicted transglutaminase-like cysteine proteinase